MKPLNTFVSKSFLLCTRFLQLLGKIFHLSYEQIAIILNLYIQGSILMLSGALPFTAGIYTCFHGFGWTMIICVIASLGYLSMYVMGYRWLLHRFKDTSNVYFDLCVQDLNRVSAAWKISYQMVNLLIFVVWWLSLVCFNSITAYLIATHDMPASAKYHSVQTFDVLSEIEEVPNYIYPDAWNSVLGHMEQDTISGRFQVGKYDKLYVVPQSLVEYCPQKEPSRKYSLDGKEITEGEYYDHAQYLWRVESVGGSLPPIEVFGTAPKLVFEGDLDQNGTDEFGILDTWLASGWRHYSIYTFHEGQWKYLIEPISTFTTLRASGKELARIGPEPGTISISFSEISNRCPPDGIDTIVRAGYYSISD